VAVLASEGEYLLPPPGDETHFVSHFEREIVALGLDPQGDTLRMLLADLSLVAPLPPPLTLGDLLAMLDPPEAPPSHSPGTYASISRLGTTFPILMLIPIPLSQEPLSGMM